jgi:hypothetical protein
MSTRCTSALCGYSSAFPNQPPGIGPVRSDAEKVASPSPPTTCPVAYATSLLVAALLNSTSAGTHVDGMPPKIPPAHSSGWLKITHHTVYAWLGVSPEVFSET